MQNFNAYPDPDPAVHFNADLDPALMKLMRICDHWSTELQEIHFWAFTHSLQLLNFDMNADPDLEPAFRFNADPDPVFKKNTSDPCASVTLKFTDGKILH